MLESTVENWSPALRAGCLMRITSMFDESHEHQAFVASHVEVSFGHLFYTATVA